MAGWDWLTKPQYNWRFVRNVLVKAIVLFVFLNVLYVLLNPLPWLSKLTMYNSLIPGRERLPYADDPRASYNVSLTQIEAMFSSHVISQPKADDEYRVIILGDSSVWGWLLTDEQTFDACLNTNDYHLDDGNRLVFYNLGYPVTNATKDLLILDYALQYDVDAVVWLMTLEGMYDDDQLDHPILQSNQARVRDLIETYAISLDADLLPDDASLWERTIIGQRRALGDLIRHQIYGIAWANTEVDHVNPRYFRAPVANFPNSIGVPNRAYLENGSLDQYLALDVLQAGAARIGDTPFLMVNEPIFMGSGLNSDLRYNDLYPRWIYDEYRQLWLDLAESNGWNHLDIWDAVPADQFTDFPLHYTAEWTCRVAQDMILPQVIQMAR